MKYPIGTKCWYPKFGQTTVHKVCPDCGGDKFIRAIIHDGTEYKIECQLCGPGYEHPRGYVKLTELQSCPTPTEIMGAEIGKHVEYKLASGSGYWRVDEDEICLTKEEAQAACEQKREKEQAAIQRRQLAKEKDTKTWGWHVTYHRRAVRQHEEQAEYHRRKLGIAREKANKSKAKV